MLDRCVLRADDEEWDSGKGRFPFTYAAQPDRLASPLVRSLAGLEPEGECPMAFLPAAHPGCGHNSRNV